MEIIIGILTGLISSIIITCVIEFYHDYADKKRNFNDQKQRYSRYLRGIKMLVEISFKNQEVDNLLMYLSVYEAFPYLNYNKDNSALNKSLEVQEKILKDIEDEKFLNKSKVKYQGDIIQAQYSILEMKFSYKIK